MSEEGHLAEETIELLIREALHPDQLEGVEAHLESCLMCRARVRSSFRSTDTTEPLSLSGPPPGWRPRELMAEPGAGPRPVRSPWLLVSAISGGAILGAIVAALVNEYLL